MKSDIRLGDSYYCMCVFVCGCIPQGRRGDLLVSLCYNPTANTITVNIIKARNLKAMDIGGTSGTYFPPCLLSPFSLLTLVHLSGDLLVALEASYTALALCSNIYWPVPADDGCCLAPKLGHTTDSCGSKVTLYQVFLSCPLSILFSLPVFLWGSPASPAKSVPVQTGASF